MQDKLKVAVITGTRAEYGLLRPVIRRIHEDEELELCLVATGSHLVPSLGDTIREVEADGWPIAAKLDILKGDPSLPAAPAAAETLRLFADFFKEARPDVCIVLGDRYEIFAASAAAAMLDIPLAHISGGETTEGAKDEFFRHCITKMSALHFTATADYRRRVIQLGEQPDVVYNAGSLGAENILTLPVMDAGALSADIGFDFTKPFLLSTYHPETLGGVEPAAGAKMLLDAVEKVGVPILFTAANADEGGDVINKAIADYCAAHDNAKLVKSLGVVRYLSVMRICAAVVGNSSSAIVESPTLKKPAVNIGDRQTGRIMGENTLCCPWETDAIEAAIRRAVSAEFAQSIKDMESPFGSGDASRVIVGVVKERAKTLSLKKTFYDIKFEV